MTIEYYSVLLVFDGAYHLPLRRVPGWEAHEWAAWFNELNLPGIAVVMRDRLVFTTSKKGGCGNGK